MHTAEVKRFKLSAKLIITTAWSSVKAPVSDADSSYVTRFCRQELRGEATRALDFSLSKGSLRKHIRRVLM